MPCSNSRTARKRSSGRTGRTTSQMQYQATLPTVTAAPPPYATRCAASRHHHIFFSGNVCCVLTPIPPKSAKNAETPNPHSELRYIDCNANSAHALYVQVGGETLSMRAVCISAPAFAEPRTTRASVVPAHWPVATAGVRRPTSHRRPAFCVI